MGDNFAPFAVLVAKDFKELVTNKDKNVFVMDISGDELFQAYLESFPEGTNPVYRKRTEHDCSCCKQFIRGAGNVISVEDGDIKTAWDRASEQAPHPYNIVAGNLRRLIRSKAINNLFLANKSEKSFGAEKSHMLLESGMVHTWSHFYTGDIPDALRSDTADAKKGEYKTTVGVFVRGLEETSPDAVDTVLSLAKDKALYRVEEFTESLKQFKKALGEYRKLDIRDRGLYAWCNARGPAARFRNTVIGTLVTDLSEGVELEKAVGMYESKVAPANYKRPKALVTPAMIKQAMTTIQELGLEEALERRGATISDISVRDVLWVDGAVRQKMKGGLEGMLLQAVAKQTDKVEEGKAESIGMEDFIKKILPEASSIELLFQNKHQNNLVTISAPVHPEPKQLFKWDNDFAWSYNGNIADSDIRQAVQARGGSVTGAFRFSHQWNHPGRRNASLMDLHVFLPGHMGGPRADRPSDNYGNGQRVGWNNRKHSTSGGNQDVDFVDAAPPNYIPVENTTFPDLRRMPEGRYECWIHNWRLRQPTEGGFKAEIEFAGQVFTYDYPTPLKNKEWVHVASVTLKAGTFSIEHHIPCGESPVDKWGLKTEKFVRVNTITLSPNFWGDNAVGNKHFFFLLEGCKSDEEMRGLYNEFLHPRLEQHRKVFELIGAKTKYKPTEGQLSGLGFSSTKRESIIAKVLLGKKQRLFTIHTI